MNSNKNVYVLGDNVEFSNAVTAEKTKVESVELVLPPHTNHQVSRLTSIFSEREGGGFWTCPDFNYLDLAVISLI